MHTDERHGRAPAGGFTGVTRGLWVEEPAVRFRLPDPVRTAAVRAVIVTAVTLVEAMVALLATLADSWLAFPMVIASIASTVGATWAVLDVWVTRQVFNQRHGVVSVPSSTARRLRRERRGARREVRDARRDEERAMREARREEARALREEKWAARGATGRHAEAGRVRVEQGGHHGHAASRSAAMR